MNAHRTTRILPLNPLRPNIKKQILHTSVHVLPYRISWENLIKDQSTQSPLFISSLLLLTFSIDDVLIVKRKFMLISLGHRRTGNFLPGGAVIHLPKKFLQVAQISTKQSKGN